MGGNPQYFLIPASQTNLNIGPVGGTGDYLSNIIFLGTGAATLKDGTTSLITLTASAPTNIPLGIYSKNGAWNVTTAASTSVIATGRFS
jgi:hypothetical protein